jgi:NAD(P)-dependent dehydrogenase (short-subunit alcohol dehydrogenase family)
MSNRLSGKVCIITGTGGSIGRKAALTFARERALVVGSGLNVGNAEATVEAVRAPRAIPMRKRNGTCEVRRALRVRVPQDDRTGAIRCRKRSAYR